MKSGNRRYPMVLISLAVSVLVFAVFMLVPVSHAYAAPTVRIKDIATFSGIRDNQLLGIGLITGLAGKGDSSGSLMLKKALSNLMASFGFEIDPEEIKSKNCAVVMVSSELPAFTRPGDRIDLSISSIGDARSLEGGILLQTNLKAANGEVYAVGQGKVLVSDARNSTKTVGNILSGGIVEREINTSFINDGRLSIVLKNPDFVTASMVASAVREAFEGIEVAPVDASVIDVVIPADRLGNLISFISDLESITVTPDVAGKVVIDTRSGVIIIGESVRLGKVAVSYEAMNLSVGINASSGWGDEENPSLFTLEAEADVNDLVDLLKTVGLATADIAGILQAINKAGALFGQLIIL